MAITSALGPPARASVMTLRRTISESAPDVDLDAVSAPERLDQQVGVFDREGRIKKKRAFLFCAFDQELLPVLALIRGELLQRLRMRAVKRRRHGERQRRQGRDPTTHVFHPVQADS